LCGYPDIIVAQVQPGNDELTAAGVVEEYLRMPVTEDHDFLKSALLLLMCSLHQCIQHTSSQYNTTLHLNT
jgi:hypothetical protein